jgi:choline dehydrogenase-like flavoprotein
MKTHKRQIQIRDTCPRCDGSGVEYSLLWAAFSSKFKAMGTEPTDQDEQKFFEDYGFYGKERPPEEEDCGECEGTGWIYAWADVEEFIKAYTEVQR